MDRLRLLMTLALAALLAAASAPLAAHDPLPTKVTWTRDIRRIFAARCVNCHVAGGPAPMPLATYDQVRPWTAAIREQVVTRKMPIWHAARGYGDFANDPSLSPFDVALVAAWVDGGAPEGDPGRAGAASHGAAAAAPAGPRAREVQLACGDTPIAGRLLAVNPQLAEGASASILAIPAHGAPEIVAWIRDYDPRYPTTYWLRNPIALPAGSRLSTTSAGPCSVVASLARPAAKKPTPTSERPRSRTAR
jgi:mono/diheme cytochrome c family protein